LVDWVDFKVFFKKNVFRRDERPQGIEEKNGVKLIDFNYKKASLSVD